MNGLLAYALMTSCTECIAARAPHENSQANRYGSPNELSPYSSHSRHGIEAFDDRAHSARQSAQSAGFSGADRVKAPCRARRGERFDRRMASGERGERCILPRVGQEAADPRDPRLTSR